MREILIHDKKIGNKNPTFLIAEAGVNHNGDLNLAKKLIDVAVNANVDAVKFQTFITEELLLKSTSKAEYQKKYTKNDESFFEMLRKLEFSKEQFIDLSNYCSEKQIIFLSTPFDKISVEWLEELEVPAYKVGSGDMNNFPLLKLICSKKKPILLSTGMATLSEVKDSVNFIRRNNTNDLVIFQCTTNYPTFYENVNLNVVDTYKKEFPDLIIGFSDHTTGIEPSIGAIVKGVKVIEKHFTLDKNMEGPDHKASLNPEDLKNWVKSVRNIEKTLGNFIKSPTASEAEIAKIARKSIISQRNLEIGDIITLEDISIKRPGVGIPPNEYEKVIGKKIKKVILKDSIIRWDDLE